MADILTFDPVSEFEVLESFEFEEDVQRPEELRFFTLDEQLLDFQAKILSSVKKPTKFEKMRVLEESDRYRQLYDKLIIPTDEEIGYKIDTTRKTIDVPWVTPIYSGFEYVSYSYATNWIPLMDKVQVRNPNYYNRLISALPRPYRTTEQKGTLITETTKLVNEAGDTSIHGMGQYIRTKGVIHDDGTSSVVKLPMPNTQDDIRIKGYYLSSRGVDIPNPLSEHPFLSSTKPSVLLTDELLVNVFPSIQAVLNHGVPTTTDPYNEGLKFLKLYDVRLNQIPWALWKQRFPPVDPIGTSPQVLSLSFPSTGDELAPPESLQKTYSSKWYPGLFHRYWIMKQEDAGLLAIKMYLSKASDVGLVATNPVGEGPLTMYPDSTPEECMNFDSFDNLINSAVYRDPGKCVPAESIQRERTDFLYKNRKPWAEDQADSIIREHLILLKKYQLLKDQETKVVYEKYVNRPESEIRKDVLTILSDGNRTPEDKAEAIQLLVNMIMPENELYLDKDGSFIICSHTLAELRGEGEDRITFYEKWASIVDGFRVCKFCSENINSDVLVAQDDFDGFGNVIKNYGVLDDTTIQYLPDENVSAFNASLLELKDMFILQNAGEAILYMILALLQILPSKSVLLPIIQHIRKLSGLLRARKVEKSIREKTEGTLGICGAVILLLTHIPFIIPKRSFGLKVVKLSGFPRDTQDSEDAPILDMLLYGLQSTYKQYSSAFVGETTAVLNAIRSRPKDVRKEAVRFLTSAFSEFKMQLEMARERYVAPSQEVHTQNLFLPLIHIEKLEYSPGERFGDEESMSKCDIPRIHNVITGKLLPSVSQSPLELDKNLSPSRYLTYLTSEGFVIEKIRITDKEIRSRLALRLPKLLKGNKLNQFLERETIDGISVLTMLNRLLDVLSLDKFSLDIITKYRQISVFLETQINKSLLRDIAKGFVYELLHDVNKDKNRIQLGKTIDDAMLKDVVMNMLLFTKEEADRIVQAAATKEREKFKSTMRSMNDTERELTKMLLDIGMAPHIITNEYRILVAREFNYPDPEEEYNRIMGIQDQNMPEDGHYENRDYVDNGDIPVNQNGHELAVDNGGYGEMDAYDIGDYGNQTGDADFDDGYGF
jgi:hypothetical protein